MIKSMRTSSESGAEHGWETIYTIGHSTHSVEAFVGILLAQGIELIADVRRFPGSRRLPHFESDALARALAGSGIEYQWLPALGGRRRTTPDSINLGWRHPAFRGYADYLATDEFAGGLFELLVMAGGLRTAMMCAEVLWWRCHRRLIADVLVSIGVDVFHIRNAGTTERHRLLPPARLSGGRLGYGS
jgi:uncharacterized protein (DUF488 family)